MARNKGVEDIRFDIENLLSADNLMNTDSVKVLQNKLNRYVFGLPALEEDGRLGPKTLKGIKTYRQESRYWGGHSKIKIDPREQNKGYNMHFEDIPDSPYEGGGDQGAW